jgi:hypothetical protein
VRPFTCTSEFGFLDARDFGDDDEVIALAEHVHRRVGAAAARARVKPTALAVRVQRLLETRKRVERI